RYLSEGGGRLGGEEYGAGRVGWAAVLICPARPPRISCQLGTRFGVSRRVPAPRGWREAEPVPGRSTAAATMIAATVSPVPMAKATWYPAASGAVLPVPVACRPLACAAARVDSTATPSAAPICWAVLNRPEGSPATGWGGTRHPRARQGGRGEPAPAAKDQRGRERGRGVACVHGEVGQRRQRGGEERQPRQQHGALAEARGNAGVQAERD